MPFNTTSMERDQGDSWASAGRAGGGIIGAIFGGENVRQKAQMQSMGQMAKLNQAQATARYANARAGLDENQLALQQDPMNSAMLKLGLPTALAPAFKNRLETGSFGPSYEAPVDGIGPTQPAPADSDTVAKLGRAVSLIQRMYASGGNMAQSADAELKEQQARQIEDVAANPSRAGLISTAQAAGHGKPLYNPTGNTGQSVQMMTGEAGPVNAVLAKLFQTGENAQANQRNAAAGASSAAAANSYASAGQHRAQTQKVNQEISMGSKGVLQQTERGLMLVDPRAGTARVVTGPDGVPVAGKSKDMNEGQAKANLFGSRMREAGSVLNGLEDRGFKTPSLIKQGLSKTPMIGGSLELLANKTVASGEQQQVEQAQRDFVNAVLRRESGAAISESEFSNATKQYFPQPGDGKEVLLQKRRNRELATTLMLSEVPESHRRKPQSGATGSWGETTPAAAPANSGGWSIKRVE